MRASHFVPCERIVAGCKLHKINDDGSEVFDWYYDVSDLEDAAVMFDEPVTSVDEVRALCSDRSRYEEGATFVERP